MDAVNGRSTVRKVVLARRWCQTVPHSTGVVLEYVRLGLEYRQGEDCRVHLGYTLRLQGRTSKDV